MALLIGGMALCGCSHQYLVKLNNGDEVVAYSKPKRHGAYYRFKDAAGVPHAVLVKRVVKIKSGRVPSESVQQSQPPAAAPPKKSRHWYLLWLG